MTASAGKVAAIAATSLRRMLRDRTALFFVLVLPVFITLLVGLAIGNTTRARLAVADRGSGPLGVELVRLLAQSRDLEVRHVGSPAALRAAVRHDEVIAGVIVPAGYDGAVRAGRHVGVELVTKPTSASQAARSVIGAVVDQQEEQLQAAIQVSMATGRAFRDVEPLVRAAAASGPGVGVRVRAASGTGPLPQGFSYTAPSNLVLFVFITSLASSGVLVLNRKLGITRRMLATPTSRVVVLAGEGLGRFAIALFQAGFILLFGWIVFGVTWGDPLAVAVVVLLFAAVATGVGVLVGTTLRTEEQAASLGPPIGIALGMLGGCMWPISIVPTFLRLLGHAAPHAWAMDAFIRLIGRGGHLTDIWPNVVALLAFAVVLVPLGAWRLRSSAA